MSYLDHWAWRFLEELDLRRSWPQSVAIPKDWVGRSCLKNRLLWGCKRNCWFASSLKKTLTLTSGEPPHFLLALLPNMSEKEWRADPLVLCLQVPPDHWMWSGRSSLTRSLAKLPLGCTFYSGVGNLLWLAESSLLVTQDQSILGHPGAFVPPPWSPLGAACFLLQQL